MALGENDYIIKKINIFYLWNKIKLIILLNCCWMNSKEKSIIFCITISVCSWIFKWLRVQFKKVRGRTSCTDTIWSTDLGNGKSKYRGTGTIKTVIKAHVEFVAGFQANQTSSRPFMDFTSSNSLSLFTIPASIRKKAKLSLKKLLSSSKEDF